MEFLLIIPIGLYLLVAIPAFMFTWEGSVFEGIGCYGWFCMIAGFPAVILALILKGIVKLFKLPEERRIAAAEETRRRRQQQEEEDRRRQEAAQREEYQRSLIEKRDRIYPNSPVTREIVAIITQGPVLPYEIEINEKGLIIRFENVNKSYVFGSHGLPNMNADEQKIFAQVLNQKLNGRYGIADMTDWRSLRYSDGTLGGYTVHLGVKMALKATRTF